MLTYSYWMQLLCPYTTSPLYTCYNWPGWFTLIPNSQGHLPPLLWWWWYRIISANGTLKEGSVGICWLVGISWLVGWLVRPVGCDQLEKKYFLVLFLFDWSFFWGEWHLFVCKSNLYGWWNVAMRRILGILAFMSSEMIGFWTFYTTWKVGAVISHCW